MKTVIVCSGGPVEEVVDFKQLPFSKEDTFFIGADRGALHLLTNGITPHEIIGDFDSLKEEEFHLLESTVEKVTVLQAEKDETDTHIAILRAIEYKPDNIILTAVTGGRLDHYEAVLHDMIRFQMNYPEIVFYIRNKQNIIRFLLPGIHEIKPDPHFKYISFFSYGETVENISLRGFLYEVTKENISFGNSKFTSNEVSGRIGTISFTAGICLMIRSSD
ncbi:thiamine diphosphokinase [Psychrobacillus sp. FJAT-21963]|uniref:thiamine diphosphokinase n=1 Tax=Psychrobacillus sp. FJAT-21963 TaxID=1712028 RepID=UPI0006F563F3|nr:thiamine diphosphokinase [Psychrobacillus sp. FJAT-21963]KQL35476.1 thiamine pyrophosphokinase [Psychrobacillus sp. FJAT-21963]